MAQLTELLQNSESFQSLTPEQQEVFGRLAAEFEDNPLALYLNPLELTTKLQVGNKNLWHTFLQMDSVEAYIRSQMAFDAKVASRKAFGALEFQAKNGDTTAAKQINELAGIYNKTDNLKVVVLHQISRSKKELPTNA